MFECEKKVLRFYPMKYSTIHISSLVGKSTDKKNANYKNYKSKQTRSRIQFTQK